MSTLEDYKRTGFSPEQINTMYENLTNTYDLISRLTCGDVGIVEKAIRDCELWIDGYLSYCKKEYH